MDQLSSRIKQLTTELKEYFEIKLNLVVLNLGEQISALVGESIQKMVGYIILGVGLFFALIALAIYVGELLNNPALGYLSVSLPLLIIGLIFALTSKGISKGIQTKLMGEILKAIETEKPEVLKLPEAKGQEIDEEIG